MEDNRRKEIERERMEKAEHQREKEEEMENQLFQISTVSSPQVLRSAPLPFVPRYPPSISNKSVRLSFEYI
jgi:hypothetical protein